MPRLLAVFMVLTLLTTASCGGDSAESSAEWTPVLKGLWTLDQDASLEASRNHTGGDATPERRKQAVASFVRQLEQVKIATAEFRDDGRMTLRFDKGDGKPDEDNKSYVVESVEAKRVSIKIGTRVDVLEFESANRMRGTSGRGLLVQYWDRTP